MSLACKWRSPFIQPVYKALLPPAAPHHFNTHVHKAIIKLSNPIVLTDTIVQMKSKDSND